MGDPELRNDEKVLVRTPGVYVKSIPFEGILTNKRVILVDRAKNLLPPKEIPLATVKEVEAGENAIRDQILTLSVMAKTGETRQMILTFSRQEGGNRIKERDEWARHVRANIGSSFENVIRKVIPGTEPAPRRVEEAPRRVSVINTSTQPAPTVPSPVRRDTDGIHPIKKIIEAGTVAPAPSPVREFDASALGQSVFCSRCGNKVPTDSAFCNRCGSPVIAPAAPAPSPQPAVPPAAPAPVPSAPALRPIDRDIQTIEPLIERSTERIPADPLRKPIPDVPVHQSLAWDDDAEPTTEPVAAPAPIPAEPTAAAPVTPAEKPAGRSFLPKLFSPKARTQGAPAPAPMAAPPVPPRPRRNLMPGRNVLLGIGAIIVVLIILAVGVLFVYPMLTSGGVSLPSGSGDATPVPTTSSSSTAISTSGTVVPIETKAVAIPPTGVYVHANYIGGFKGTYGLPDSLTTVPGNSGDRIWEVENATGTVQAEFEKLDGSKHELLVEIYKDGVVLTRSSTTIGHGSVKLSVDTVTGIAAEPISSGGGTAAAVTPAAATTTAVAAANATVATTTTTAPAVNTTAST